MNEELTIGKLVFWFVCVLSWDYMLNDTWPELLIRKDGFDIKENHLILISLFLDTRKNVAMVMLSMKYHIHLGVCFLTVHCIPDISAHCQCQIVLHTLTGCWFAVGQILLVISYFVTTITQNCQPVPTQNDQISIISGSVSQFLLRQKLPWLSCQDSSW